MTLDDDERDDDGMDTFTDVRERRRGGVRERSSGGARTVRGDARRDALGTRGVDETNDDAGVSVHETRKRGRARGRVGDERVWCTACFTQRGRGGEYSFGVGDG